MGRWDWPLTAVPFSSQCLKQHRSTPALSIPRKLSQSWGSVMILQSVGTCGVSWRWNFKSALEDEVGSQGGSQAGRISA